MERIKAAATARVPFCKAAALKAFPFNLCAPAEKLTKFTALNTCVLAAAATGAAPLGGWLSRGDYQGGRKKKRKDSEKRGGLVKATNATFGVLCCHPFSVCLLCSLHFSFVYSCLCTYLIFYSHCP